MLVFHLIVTLIGHIVRPTDNYSEYSVYSINKVLIIKINPAYLLYHCSSVATIEKYRCYYYCFNVKLTHPSQSCPVALQ